MKTKKKNRFFTFCFSFLPGAGEMYMGFMKTGVSLMTVFFLSFLIPMTFYLDVLSVFAIVVWFYGFFHANHLGGLSDEEFAEVKDEYLFGMDMVAEGQSFVHRYQKGIAAALIAAGVFLLWNSLTDIADAFLPGFVVRVMWSLGNYIPRILVGALIIWLGVKMIRGKKTEILKEEKEERASAFEEAGNPEAEDGGSTEKTEQEAHL